MASSFSCDVLECLCYQPLENKGIISCNDDSIPITTYQVQKELTGNQRYEEYRRYMPQVEKKAGNPGHKRPAGEKKTSPGLKRGPSVSVNSDFERPVELRTCEKTYVIPGERLKPISMQWYYMVRHRNRWSDSLEARQSL